MNINIRRGSTVVDVCTDVEVGSVRVVRPDDELLKTLASRIEHNVACYTYGLCEKEKTFEHIAKVQSAGIQAGIQAEN